MAMNTQRVEGDIAELKGQIKPLEASLVNSESSTILSGFLLNEYLKELNEFKEQLTKTSTEDKPIEIQSNLEEIKETSKELLEVLYKTYSDNNQQVGGNTKSALVDMQIALLEFEELYAKFTSDKQDLETKIGNGLVNALKNAYDDVVKEVKKAESKESSARSWGLFAKIASYVLIALSVAIGLVSGGIGTALVIGAVGALMASGALNDATKELSKGLQEAGIPASQADFLANLIVLVVVIVVTAGASGTIDAAATTASDAVEDTGEVGANAVSKSSNEAVEDASKVKFKGIKFNGKVGTLNGLQIAAQQGFIGSLILAFPSKDKDKQKEAAQILNIIEDVIAVIGSIGVSASLVQDVSSSNLLELLPTLIAKNLPKIMQAAFVLEFVGGAAQGASQIGAGSYTVESANAKGKTAEPLGTIALDTTVLKMNNSQIKAEQTEFQSSIQNFQNMNKSFGDLYKGYEAITRVLQA